MRIPSQLNNQTLYGRRGKRSTPPNDSFRRVIRLGLALLLVVVVMQQAGQPAIYETFFPGVASQPIQAESSDSSSADQGRHAVPLRVNFIPPDRVAENTVQAAKLITQSMRVTEQRQWLLVLDQWQKGKSFRVMEPVIDVTINSLDHVEGLSDPELTDWKDALRKFGQAYASADRIPPDSGVADPFSAKSTQSDDTNDQSESDSDFTDGQRELLNAWVIALDDAAMDRVVDGAVWMAGDVDAFYRQLDQAIYLDPAGAAAVTVVPLMQQSETYLGSKVRVQGKVARCEKKVAAGNSFGISDYWELWIRPNRGGDRPIVVMVTDVPDAVAKVGNEQPASKGPEIKVLGRFFKRLAYASQYGADAAPVIVGRLVGYSGGDNAKANFIAKTEATPKVKRELWTILAAALVIGIGVSAVVMHRTKVMANKSREIRDQHRAAPDAFLEKLDVAAPTTPGPNSTNGEHQLGNFDQEAGS